jgi:hypothetical protein
VRGLPQQNFLKKKFDSEKKCARICESAETAVFDRIFPSGTLSTLHTLEYRTMAKTINTVTRKTSCPITRQVFKDHGAAATPVVTIAGQHVSAVPKTFSTGSVGYYGNGKVQLMVDGVAVMCQVSVNVTVIGSGDLPALPTVISPEVAAIMAASKAKEAELASGQVAAVA